MKLTMTTAPALALISVLGCSQTSGVEEAIRSNLKDPSSAMFKDLVVSADKQIACITWNAKNSFGGYGNWRTSELRIQQSKWVVKIVEQDPALCSREFFQLRDEEKELHEKILQMKDAPEDLKASIREAQNIEHHHPGLMKKSVESLKRYIEESK